MMQLSCRIGSANTTVEVRRGAITPGVDRPELDIGRDSRRILARTFQTRKASPDRDLAVPAPASESIEQPERRRESASVVVSRFEVGRIGARDWGLRLWFGDRAGGSQSWSCAKR